MITLNDEQEQRAQRLHNESIIVDMVNMGVGGSTIYDDPILAAAAKPLINGDNDSDKLMNVGMAQLLPYQLAAAGHSNAIESAWRESGLTAASTTWPSISDENISLFQGLLEPELAKLDWIQVVKSAADIRRCKESNKHAMFWFCQPQTGVGIPQNLNQLDKAKAAGLLSLMLTYNSMDVTGVGCTERVDAGLSYFGQSVIERCNKLGIIVDTSHCSRMTTLDACHHSSKPVTANHTCAKAIYDCNRSKSDEEIIAVADTGGLIGVVAVPFFLSGQTKPSIEIMLDHIDHMINLVGAEHVGIATDWPMQGPKALIDDTFVAHSVDMGFRPEDNFSSAGLEGLEDSRGLRNITRGMVQRGHSDEDIKSVLGENFLRVLEEVQNN